MHQKNRKYLHWQIRLSSSPVLVFNGDAPVAHLQRTEEYIAKWLFNIGISTIDHRRVSLEVSIFITI